jgi:FMN phosphatase YigB (HAD superfamily)
MITAILSDFSRVIVFPKDKNYKGALNYLHFKLTEKYGDYDFYDYFKFNEELLDYYQSLKGKCSLNIFTTGVFQDHPQARQRLEPIFDNIFSAYKSKLDKSNPSSYLYIAKKLGKKSFEILFIDDKKEFIKAARKAGLSARLFQKLITLKRDIRKALEEGSKE